MEKDIIKQVKITDKEAIAQYRYKGEKTCFFSARYSFKKYRKDIAILLANYSLESGERLNNWIEFENDLIKIFLYSDKNDKMYYGYIHKKDWDKIKDYYWRVEFRDKDKLIPSYIITSQGSKSEKRPDIRMHSIIKLHNDDMVIDHKDGNGLNNNYKNLRIVTQKENIRNRKMNINNKIGFKNIRSCKPNRDGYEVNLYDENNKRYTKYFPCSKYKTEDDCLLAAAIHAEEKQMEFNYLHSRYNEEQRLYNSLCNLINKK